MVTMNQPPRIEQTKLVGRMFGRIAHRYDAGNRILSLGQDQGWRRRAAALLEPEPEHRVLDIGAGTGDLTLMLARQTGHVVGLDLSGHMVRLAKDKAAKLRLDGRASFVVADALRLPFPDETFHRVSIAFTVRNLPDHRDGFAEIRRVLRPNGRMVCLEFTQPASALMRGLYRPYLNHVLPFLGGRITGDSAAYRYLANSINAFPSAEALGGVIRDAGFHRVDWRHLNFGTVALHVADRRPARDPSTLNGAPQ